MQEDNKAIYQMRFPQKLWYLINLRTDAIIWGGTGRTILLNYRILHNYLQCDNSVFKTNNISSFVRQLNLYGFRKVTSHLQDPLCNSSNPFMHEYIHDYFQFGRPELLNKIIRKALNIRKNLKHRSNICNEVPQSAYVTPLQKARRAFRLALKNAAQNLYIQCSTAFYNYEDGAKDSCEEEIIDVDLFYSKSPNTECNYNIVAEWKDPLTKEIEEKLHTIKEDNDNAGDTNETNSMEETEDADNSNNESPQFPTQFLSMPDLDPEPMDDHDDGVELLGEFHINNDADEGITKKINFEKENTENEMNSLNCVLPSISSDYQNDDVMADNGIDTGHYHGEWEQMFNDIINKGQNHEGNSDMKELYCHISRTLDVLNS